MDASISQVKEAPYDFFVSYARTDNATGWITRLVEELLAGHKKVADTAGAGSISSALTI